MAVEWWQAVLAIPVALAVLALALVGIAVLIRVARFVAILVVGGIVQIVDRWTGVTSEPDVLEAATVPMCEIRVSDDDGDGVFVAADTVSTVYGAGPTPEAAVADYHDSFRSSLSALEENEGRLGPGVRAELATMRAVMAAAECNQRKANL